jgi:hypothetical protein
VKDNLSMVRRLKHSSIRPAVRSDHRNKPSREFVTITIVLSRFEIRSEDSSDATLIVFPAKAGIHISHGHRRSPV